MPSGRDIGRSALVAACLLAAAPPANAAGGNCTAVGGGVLAGPSAVGLRRDVRVDRQLLRISKPGGRGFYTLPCRPLAGGVYCQERTGDGSLLTLMTNGDRMIEAVHAPGGREILRASYRCRHGSLRPR